MGSQTAHFFLYYHDYSKCIFFYARNHRNQFCEYVSIVIYNIFATNVLSAASCHDINYCQYISFLSTLLLTDYVRGLN